MLRNGELQSNISYQPSKVEQIRYEPIKESEGVFAFSFDKILITMDYSVKIKDTFNFAENKPVRRTEPLNPHYVVIGEGESIAYGDEVTATIKDRLEFPPILTIMDLDFIEKEDQCLVDQMIIHTLLIAKKKSFTNFFLILEETGDVAFGEPALSEVNVNKGLFKKTIYSITFDNLIK